MFRLSIPMRRAFAKKRVVRRKPVKKAAKISAPLRRAVKKLVRGQSETKRSTWFQDYNDGTVTTRATGLVGTRGYAVQNNTISANETDILRLIPYVPQSLDTFGRIGDRIQPIGLTVKGSIRVKNVITLNAAGLQTANINVHVYVLEHVSLKDYDNLYAKNNFAQLLDTGSGLTVIYGGEPISDKLRVSSQYYKVLQRKKVTLRFAGSWPYLPPVTPTPGVAGAYNGVWHADYTMNLGKHLPKVLKYPESLSSTSPVVVGAPTNAAPFMCMGFDTWAYPSNFGATAATLSTIEQTYVSELSYKDM